MQLTQVKKLESRYILGTYARYDVLIERGSGATLIDHSNKRYLDLLAGIGVNALGYNHPRVKLMLCTLSGLDRAFFTNSGTEAIEGCLKFARAWGGRAGKTDKRKFRILALENSFHGRTFGALSATASA